MIPTKNIEWTKIPAGALVTELRVGSSTMYVVKVEGQPDAVPFWSGHESSHAQAWLNTQVKRGKPVTGKQLFMRNHLT
jgi:hypothetical protein